MHRCNADKLSLLCNIIEGGEAKLELVLFTSQHRSYVEIARQQKPLKEEKVVNLVESTKGLYFLDATRKVHICSEITFHNSPNPRCPCPSICITTGNTLGFRGCELVNMQERCTNQSCLNFTAFMSMHDFVSLAKCYGRFRVEILCASYFPDFMVVYLRNGKAA